MCKNLIIVIGLAACAGLCYSAQRIRVIDVDHTTNAPLAASAVNVALTGATTGVGTNTFVGMTCLLTNVVGNTTNVYTIVTNVQGIVTGNYGFTEIGRAHV